MTKDLADSIKRLRENLPMAVAVIEKSVVISEEIALATKTINQLVELVAEMRAAFEHYQIKFKEEYIDSGKYANCPENLLLADYHLAQDTLTKADALLTKLGEV